MTAYYNEFEPYAANWLRNLISAGLIPPGDVDTRSITDVQPDDLRPYTQCHFFAGLGGWAYAVRLANWPDDREIWTGSPPCQPFSVAGKQRGADDDRHLWPHLFRLIAARRPAVFMGEQVAAAIGKNWVDGIFADLEGIHYAGRAVVVPACAVNAPHRRDRLWFVAHPDGERGQIDSNAGRCAGRSGARPVAGLSGASDGAMADANDPRSQRRGSAQRHERDAQRQIAPRGGVDALGPVAHADIVRTGKERQQRSGQLGGIGGNSSARAASACAWDGAEWIIGHDGKARRAEPGIRLLANGVSARVGRLRAYGNAIVPQVAAEVIAAYMHTADER